MASSVVEEVQAVRISLSMATMNAVAEEEVPKAVLNTTYNVERPYRRRLTTLDPGKSLNCPPGRVAHGRGPPRARALLLHRPCHQQPPL